MNSGTASTSEGNPPATKRPSEDSEELPREKRHAGDSITQTQDPMQIQDPMHRLEVLLSICALENVPLKWEDLPFDKQQLQCIDKELQFCIETLSRCQAEIQLMKQLKIPASTISHHQLVTRVFARALPRLQTGSVHGALRTEFAWRNFPSYANLIIFKLQKIEERRAQIDRCLECFSLLSSPLPLTCLDIVMICLSEEDLENCIRAFQLEA